MKPQNHTCRMTKETVKAVYPFLMLLPPATELRLLQAADALCGLETATNTSPSLPALPKVGAGMLR